MESHALIEKCLPHIYKIRLITNTLFNPSTVIEMVCIYNLETTDRFKQDSKQDFLIDQIDPPTW